MNDKALILSIAKDLYIARTGKDLKYKSFSDAVKDVLEALKLLES